ncbi:perilipin-2 [Aplysia californica]|uniref:Perilipin-2 n=1 Tax=Aplysia californica TaxID=6500 RepID=A0ABM0JYM7_APLCA|nr:perilipin-2 [Aplysia californica]
MPMEETFVNRLGEIPVLNDSWTTAWGCYARIKDMNRVTKFTLETAESSVKTAAKMSAPVVTRCQPQIETLNSFACTKLDELENKYPSIMLPSEEVKDACLEYVQPVLGCVKPVVSCVQGVVDDSKRKVNYITSQGTRLVVGARDLGVGTVTGAVNMTLASPPGRLATRTFDGALTIADGLVDKYIPEIIEAEQEIDDDDDSDESSEDAQDNGSENEVQEMEVMEPSPERVQVHFRTVSKKLRRRLFQRAMRDYQGAKARTAEAVGKLHGVVDLIDYAKSNLGNAKVKAEEMWEKVTADGDNGGDNAQNGTLFAGTLEERIVVLGRMLTQQVRSGFHTLERVSHSAGQFARHPIAKSQEYKELVAQFATLQSLQNASNAGVEKIRSNVRYIQVRLQQLIDSVESPEWLAVNIEMEELEIDESDILDPARRELQEDGVGEEPVQVEEPAQVEELAQVEEAAQEEGVDQAELDQGEESEISRHENPA